MFLLCSSLKWVIFYNVSILCGQDIHPTVHVAGLPQHITSLVLEVLSCLLTFMLLFLIERVSRLVQWVVFYSVSMLHMQEVVMVMCSSSIEKSAAPVAPVACVTSYSKYFRMM